MSEGVVRESTVEWHERVVDGVRVLHFPGDRTRTQATLIFGVGERNETLPTRGTLHALEHAVMSGVRRTPIEINGSVGASTTMFTADGSPAHVSAFLEGVCRGLLDPPTDRIAHEAKVLEAEDGEGAVTSPAAIARYGFQGLGVMAGRGPGPSGVRAEYVRATAARWFVAANALLVIEGECPRDLRLPLPTGPLPIREQVPIRHRQRPAVITVEAPVCELNLLVPVDPAALSRVAVTVLDDRLTEVLRHERGLVYTLDIDAVRVPGWYDLTVSCDPTPERIRDCVRAMVETLRTLMTDGPTEAEVEHARAVIIESFSGRDAAISRVVDPAIEDLIGVGARPVDLSAVPGYDRDQVAAYLAQSAQDLVYVVDEKVEDELESLGLELIDPGVEAGQLPPGEVFRPPLLTLTLNKAARASRIALSSTGLAHCFAGQMQRIVWSDVVGVMRDEDGDLVVFGREGQAMPLGPTMYKHGHRLADTVLANVPGSLVYDAPCEPEGSEA